jgi:D-methionine transport system ATP-binding protein
MIEIQGVSKTFRGDRGPVEVLRDVTLSIREGEIFGIIGRSGAGKSTLVRCINLLERPTAGRVTVAGRELTALDVGALRQARHRVGMIFQHFNLLSSRTVLDNVALPLELAGATRAAAREAATPLLEVVGLSGKVARYPSELSGGEKQRVGIARALATEPAVLLCDEATSALDPETTTSILALLRDINRKLGLTIVLITHEMQVIREICERVAVLDHGRVVEQGTVFDVFTSPVAEVTRRFVRDLVDRDLPPSLVARLGAPPAGLVHPVLRIVFTGPSALQPIVAEAVRRHGVLLNILQATIDEIQGQPYGNVVVEAIGRGADVQAALEFIRGNQLKVEVIGHVPGDARVAA